MSQDKKRMRLFSKKFIIALNKSLLDYITPYLKLPSGSMSKFRLSIPDIFRIMPGRTFGNRLPNCEAAEQFAAL
jgi:hypothetical protein